MEIRELKNGKKAWVITKWYGKVLYVLGWIYFIIIALYFISGFVSGVNGQ